MTVIEFLKDFVLLHEAAPIYLICAHTSAIEAISFVYFTDILVLAIQIFVVAWSLDAIFRLKRSKVYPNLSIRNRFLTGAVLVHLYGVSIRSTDLLLPIGWVSSPIVAYWFLLEYNFPGITSKELRKKIQINRLEGVLG